MRGHLLIVFLLIFTLLLGGISSLRGEVIALVIPLVIYLVLALLRGKDILKLNVERTLSTPHSLPDRPVQVRLTITNQGGDLKEVKISDLIPYGLEINASDHTSILTCLPAGGSITLEYTVQGGRGEYRFDEVKINANEDTGLFPLHTMLHAPRTLVVEPVKDRLRPIRIRPPQTRGFAGPIPARMGGDGVDFFGLREYQSGDALRHINWKVSARNSSELFTTVFEQERIADVGIILDARQQSEVRFGDHSLFEYSVQAAASLSETFLKDGNRVGLLVYGFGMSTVFPGYGKIQQLRIQQALGRARTGLNYALENLSHLPVRFFPARSQVILVSALLPEDVAVLLQLKSRGYSIMLVSPNPVRFEAALGGYKDSLNHRLALRAAGVERAFMLQRVKRAGIVVVDWDVNQTLNAVLRRSLARQPMAQNSLEGVNR